MLAEGDGQQARAEQHEAGCGQRQKSIGNEVMITHGTPAVPDAGPNPLKLSESALWLEVPERLARDQARERKPSKAWARKMPALTSPKIAVTVSIIALILASPVRSQRHGGPHSQKNFAAKPAANRRSGATDDFAQQVCGGRPPSTRCRHVAAGFAAEVLMKQGLDGGARRRRRGEGGRRNH